MNLELMKHSMCVSFASPEMESTNKALKGADDKKEDERQDSDVNTR